MVDFVEYITYEEVYKAYKDCAKHKRKTANAANFEIDEYENIYHLYEVLNTKKYVIGCSITFLCEFPKWREIFAADFIDRIVQHIIVNRLNPFLEKEFIPNSFSCRKNKGTLRGLKTLQKEAYELSYNFKKKIYILKCDCRSYFYSLDKRILFQKVIALIDKYNIFDNKIKDFYIDIIKQIIFNTPQYHCKRKGTADEWERHIDHKKSLFYCDKFHGLPIGNVSSQVFSNVYMNDFDHWVTEKLGFKYYGRYCDDFYILSDSKEKLLDAVIKIREYLQGINITLHPNKIYIQEFSKGVTFIGGIVKENRTYISNRTLGRCYNLLIKTYNYAQHNELTKEDLQYFVTSLNSYFGFFKHHKTYNIRKKIAKSEYLKPFLGEYIHFNKDYEKVILNDKYK